MNYQKIYERLVEKAKIRGLDKSSVDYYTEIHHVIPRSLGGSNGNDNLVMFSGREHFIAHMLLWRAYPENTSLMRAAHIMSSRWANATVGGSGAGINSKVYTKLREEYAKAVSEQWSGENNPMYGKTHSPEIFERMSKTRAKTSRKNSLANWKVNNDRYMAQYSYKEKTPEPFVINIGSPFDVFRFKGGLKDWLSFEVYKDFWIRSGKTGAKDFSTKVVKVSGMKFSATYFRTMVSRFCEDFNPSSNPDFIVKALNNNCDSYISKVEQLLSKTLEEIENEYISDWLLNRDSYREIITNYVFENGIEKHKNNSKAKMTLVDVIEANILWHSGKVQQKQISELYGVARNSISNALEAEGSWLSCRTAAKEIMENYFV